MSLIPRAFTDFQQWARLGLLALFCLLAPDGAMASSFEEAEKAEASGDHRAALALLRPLAVAGDARAQSKLGYFYARGHGGLAIDHQQAAYWYQLAAAAGEAEAEQALGLLYYNGWGVEKDHERAVYYLLRAAEKGHVAADGHSAAATLLGDRYCYGEGVEVDEQQALYWYRRGAALGDQRARLLLGFVYQGGERPFCDHPELGDDRRVAPNLLFAFVWLSIAQEDPDQARLYEDLTPKIDALAVRLSPSELIAASRLIAIWRAQAPGSE